MGYFKSSESIQSSNRALLGLEFRSISPLAASENDKSLVPSLGLRCLGGHFFTVSGKLIGSCPFNWLICGSKQAKISLRYINLTSISMDGNPIILKLHEIETQAYFPQIPSPSNQLTGHHFPMQSIHRG